MADITAPYSRSSPASSQFASKVPREPSIPLDKKRFETPGPGSYSPAAPPNQYATNTQSTGQLYHKRVPFGSVNERTADFLTRDVMCPFVDRSSVQNPTAGQYQSTKRSPLPNSSVLLSSQQPEASLNLSSYMHSNTRVHKGSSLGRLKTLDEVEEDTQQRPLEGGRQSLLKYATKEPARPGPGHYQLDLPDQIR